MLPKVSVLIATYRSGEGLDRVMRSLAAQTLPASEFEIIFVDDGSPDDTWGRLERIAQRFENVRIERIDNSGWPSKPRNLAMSLAKGEYVLFMDHDDELSPDALRAAYELGHANNADAVNAKESRTQFAGWSQQIFTRTLDNAIGEVDPNPLMPMNPHKLYRREFLLEHGILFPEGRRYIWEDIFFNIEVYRHAEVISLLSDTAFYHWVRTGQNNSSSYEDDLEERWQFLHRIFEHIHEQLGEPMHQEARDALLAHHFGGRALDFFGPSLLRRSDSDIELVMERMRDITRRLVPAELDERLDKVRRARAVAVREGSLEVLRELATIDAGIVGTSEATRVEWIDGRLLVTARASWSKPFQIDRVGDRWVRRVPRVVRELLPADLLDVTDEVHAAGSEFGIRNRADKSVWQLPTEQRQRFEPTPAGLIVEIESETTLDIDDAVFGKALWAPRWVFTARNSIASTLNQRAVRMALPPVAALVNGRAVIAFANRDGHLALDIGQRVRSIVNAGRPDFARAAVTEVVSIPLPGVSVHGTTILHGRAVFLPLDGIQARFVNSGRLAGWRFIARTGLIERLRNRTRFAKIIGDDGAARLEFGRLRTPGRYRLSLEFDGHRAVTAITVVVGPLGRMRLEARTDQ